MQRSVVPPKVSICIPAYNQVDYLQKTLESIVIQTYQDYEVVVTDDSPDDRVERLIDKFNFEGKLKYVKNVPSLGSPENWNEAVRFSKGEYIKIMHHDDFFNDENSLHEFVQLLDQNPNADFAFCATLVMKVKNNNNYIHTPTQLDVLMKEPTILFFGNLIGAPSATIYRRKTNTEYDKNLKWVVDMEYYISLLLKNKQFAHTSKTLITTISGAEHTVTNLCINNKKIEIFEYFYLYNKILAHIPKKRQVRYIIHLWNLVVKYKIKTIEEIKECGYRNEIPYFIAVMLNLNRFPQIISRVFVRLVAGSQARYVSKL